MINSKSITAVIADDEPLLRHHLNRTLSEVFPQLDVVASESDGKSALSSIKQVKPDVVFFRYSYAGS